MSDTGSAWGWLHRLRERGVIRVAASYAVIVWLLPETPTVALFGLPRLVRG